MLNKERGGLAKYMEEISNNEHVLILSSHEIPCICWRSSNSPSSLTPFWFTWHFTLTMFHSVDCVGILKLRNADVEARIGIAGSKKKSTRARLVFRVNIPRKDGSALILQTPSSPILCSEYSPWTLFLSHVRIFDDFFKKIGSDLWSGTFSGRLCWNLLIFAMFHPYITAMHQSSTSFCQVSGGLKTFVWSSGEKYPITHPVTITVPIIEKALCCFLTSAKLDKQPQHTN